MFVDWTGAVVFGLAEALRLILELLSLLAVLIGLGAALGQALRHHRRHRHRPIGRPSHRLRLTIASWLAMALEFQLGADIVATTIAPTQEHLIQLAAVAVIRTFLNVFLAREIEAEVHHDHQAHLGHQEPAHQSLPQR